MPIVWHFQKTEFWWRRPLLCRLCIHRPFRTAVVERSSGPVGGFVDLISTPHRKCLKCGYEWGGQLDY